MTDYSQMTDEEFTKGLFGEISNLSPDKLLEFPGVHEMLTEHLHDAIITQWTTQEELPFATIGETTL